MSATQQESEDLGEMGDWQLKFLKSLSVVLNEYQKVLPTLPEMCERFISTQADTPKEPYDKSNFDSSREDEKTFLEKRKRGDLAKHLKEQLAKKEESIALLKEERNEDKKGWEKTLSDKEKDFETLLLAYKTFQQESNSSKEEYMAQLKARDEELEKSREGFQQMQRDYQAAISERDENLNKHQLRFQQMQREYQAAISERDEQLKKQQHSFQQMEEYYQSIISAKDEELNKSKYSFTQMQESAKSMISKKDGELELMECRQKELTEKFKAVLESKDEELKELKIRFAHLSEKLVKKDQRKVEDTVAKNRPSEVEKDFAEFFDGERLDAIEKMQNTYGSEEVSDIGISYPRLACMIFEAAYEQTTEVRDSALHIFKEVMNIMIEEAPERGERYLFSQKNNQMPYSVDFKMSACSRELKYPTEVLDAIVLSLKETAHLCSLESLETGVRRKILEKWLSWLRSEESCKFSYSDRLLIHLQEYIQKCIRLTWRMATQVPPMKLEYESTTLKKFHKKVEYRSSPEMCSRPSPNGQPSATDEIACYLWPALFDGGGRLIRSGEVLCKVEAKAI